MFLIQGGMLLLMAACALAFEPERIAARAAMALVVPAVVWLMVGVALRSGRCLLLAALNAALLAGVAPLAPAADDLHARRTLVVGLLLLAAAMAGPARWTSLRWLTPRSRP